MMAASLHTKPPNSSMNPLPSSEPLVTMRTVTSTPEMAATMMSALTREIPYWKVRSPMFPGWYVRVSLSCRSCTVLVTFHVEPEAELPQG